MSLPPAPRRRRQYPRRGDKCANNPQWANEPLELQRTLVCWACLPLVDTSLRPRSRPCANPRPWTKDAREKRLYEFEAYSNERRDMMVANQPAADALPPPAPVQETRGNERADHDDDDDDNEQEGAGGVAENHDEPTTTSSAEAAANGIISPGDNATYEEGQAPDCRRHAEEIDRLAQILALAMSRPTATSEGPLAPTARFWCELQAKVETLRSTAACPCPPLVEETDAGSLEEQLQCAASLRPGPVQAQHDQKEEEEEEQQQQQQQQHEEQSPVEHLAGYTHYDHDLVHPAGELVSERVQRHQEHRQHEQFQGRSHHGSSRQDWHEQPQGRSHHGTSEERGHGDRRRQSSNRGHEGEARARRHRVHEVDDHPSRRRTDYENSHPSRPKRQSQSPPSRWYEHPNNSPPRPSKRHRESPTSSDRNHKRTNRETPERKKRSREHSPTPKRRAGRYHHDVGSPDRSRRTHANEPPQGRRPVGPQKHAQGHSEHRRTTAEKRMQDAHGDGVRGNSDTERRTGSSQQASCVVACPSTKAPKIRREHDTPPAEEEQEQRWLEQEQQEWARLRACSDQHLVDGEQLSQACSAAKELAEERLTMRWNSLPTPHLFKVADVPCILLARASGAEIIALMEQNLKKKRAHLQRNQQRRGGRGGSGVGGGGGGGGGGIAPAPPREEESEEEAVKVINALLDWCRGELFPFLVEVDARMAGADPTARARFLYETLIHPLREISQQRE